MELNIMLSQFRKLNKLKIKNIINEKQNLISFTIFICLLRNVPDFQIKNSE